MPQTRHATDRGIIPIPCITHHYLLIYSVRRRARRRKASSSLYLPYNLSPSPLIRPIRPIGLIRHVGLHHTVDGLSRHRAVLNLPLPIRPIRPIGLIRHGGLPHKADGLSRHRAALNLPLPIRPIRPIGLIRHSGRPNNADGLCSCGALMQPYKISAAD